MMNWAKGALANVVGTEEPIYGPSAIHTVTKQAETTPYTELTRSDLKWNALKGTCVETQAAYFTTDSGHIVMAQVIYSCVGGLRTTCQFNTKVFYPQDAKKPNLWSSDALSNVEFSDDKCNFYATDVAVELDAAGNSYSFKSMTNQQSIVNATVTRVAPGFQVGNDGKTTYGTNAKEPWGHVRHVFWPRNKAEGTVMTKDGPINLKGSAIFVHAIQNMKPHHAAARWEFADFQGADYTAVMMQFITPKSYGTTTVNVGAIVTDTEIIMANASGTVEHTKTVSDGQNGWPEPTAIKYEWTGKTKDGKQVHAVLEGPMNQRLDKVDVMAEVPKFVKQIVAGAVGTKPYIYQFSPSTTPISLKVKVGDDAEKTESGRLFAEATFISA